MNKTNSNLVFQYLDVVEKYTLQPCDVLLKEAEEIGRNLVNIGYPLKNLAELQLEAIEFTLSKNPTLNISEISIYAYMPFKALILAYDIGYQRIIEINQKIKSLDAISLERQKIQEIIDKKTKNLLVENQHLKLITKNTHTSLMTYTQDLTESIYKMLDFIQICIEKLEFLKIQYSIKHKESEELEKYINKIYEESYHLLKTKKQLLELLKKE